MTTIKEALDHRDVSTLLLKAIRRFSEITKGDYGAAMKLIAKIVDRRAQNSQEHKILLPADAEEATKLALSKAKVPVGGADAGPSARKRRAQQVADDEPGPRRLRTPDREDAMYCEPSSPETPSRQLEDQLMSDADPDGNDSSASGQEMESRTQESLFGPDPPAPAEDADPSEHLEAALVSTIRQNLVPAASLPSPDTDSAEEPQHDAMDEDVSITEVRQRARANAAGARTISFTAAADDDWEDIAAHDLQQLFYLKAKAARAQGKQVVISFSLTQ
ncbi:hypothetical protein EJ03DRAFT_50930 [Teratosphaeria nubilosa]|uniref:Uncharacterized protein n=1 Tax=Teratosphaeria nubilosa TaxID=161662 RepID=A0A6G1LE89_9PEZI|nr:hypothetical protein EJ03DRAFT_50930 [Teratosphaeria nubilosa]